MPSVFAFALVLAASLLLPVTRGAATACASGADSAALVIDTGGQVLEYCVSLSGGSASGMDLVKLANRQYGLSYNLGFGGKAVCALAGVGVTDSGDCFADYPDFWGYWIGTGGGGWSWSSSGAADVSVERGDVQGWSWGSGDGGSGHPQPPATAYDEVCKPESGDHAGGGGNVGGGDGSDDGAHGGGGNGSTASPSPNTGSHDDRADKTAGDDAGPNADSAAARDNAAQDAKAGSAAPETPGYQRPTQAPSPLESPPAAAQPSPMALAQAGATSDAGGPPAAAIFVVGAAAALFLAGAATIRRPRGKHAAGRRR